MKKTGILGLILAAGTAQAAEPVLSAPERERARSLPHYATAAVRMPDGAVHHGNLVVAAYDDGRVRIEFSAVDEHGGGSVQGELGLANAQVTDRGELRARYRAPEGPSARYANHGTLVADGLARGAFVVRSDFRVDADGLFALEVQGEEYGRALPLQVYGRVIGTCWANDGGTLKRVVDFTRRPDCQRLFGHL